MSKTMNPDRDAQLFECHPLCEQDSLFRFQYLGAIASVVALKRDPSEAERQAFFDLANSLDLGEKDVEDQFNERDSISDEDFAVLFAAVNHQKVNLIYLLDLAWVQFADGPADQSSQNVARTIAERWSVDPKVLTTLQALVMTIRKRNFAGAVKKADLLINEHGLRNVLSKLLIFQRYKSVNLVTTRDDSSIFGVYQIRSWMWLSNSTHDRGILRWSKNVGDKVTPLECIANGVSGDGQTDIEVLAPFAGVIQMISISDSQDVGLGKVVGSLYRTDH